MSKVGILTFHFVDNHGAVLQAAALSLALRDLGHDPFFVDYTPDHVERGGRLVVPKSAADLRGNAKTIYLRLRSVASPLIGNREKKALFAAFREKHLVLSTHGFRTVSELLNSPPQADIFITGSDQVWNKSQQYGFDPAYFLQFGGASVRRMSYAASFGRGEMPAQDLETIRPWLESLNAISVREVSGRALVADSCGRDATVVPDPTFLVDPAGFVNPNTPDRGDYVFSYGLRTKRLIDSIQGMIAATLNVPVIAPQGSAGANPKNSPRFTVGPAEWLALLQRSRFVVTNSFHGTVFSILFQKPFVTVALPGAKAGYNERARNLLVALGLEHRMVASPECVSKRDLVNAPIDWDDVQQKQLAFREAGLQFLTHTLK